MGSGPCPDPSPWEAGGGEARQGGDSGIRPAPMGNSAAHLIKFSAGRGARESVSMCGGARRRSLLAQRQAPGGFVCGQMVPPLLDAVFSANGGRTSVGGAGGWVDGELACRREGGVRRRARGGPSKPSFFPTSTLLLFRGPWILRKPPGPATPLVLSESTGEGEAVSGGEGSSVHDVPGVGPVPK